MSGAMKRIALDSAQGGTFGTRRKSLGRLDLPDTNWFSPGDCTTNRRKSLGQVLSRNYSTPAQESALNSISKGTSPMPIIRSRLSSWVNESPYLSHIRKDSLQQNIDASPIYQRFVENTRSTDRNTRLASPLLLASPIKHRIYHDASPICLINRGRSKSLVGLSPLLNLKSEESHDATTPEQGRIPFPCLSPCCEDKNEEMVFHFDAEGFPLSKKIPEHFVINDNTDNYHNDDNFNHSHENNLNMINSNKKLYKKCDTSMKQVQSLNKRRASDDYANIQAKIPKIVIKSPTDQNEDSDIVCSPSKLMSSYTNRGFSSILMAVTKGNSPLGTHQSYLMKSSITSSTSKKYNSAMMRRGSLQPHLLHTPKKTDMSVSFKFPHAGVIRNAYFFTESFHLSANKRRQSMCHSSFSHFKSKSYISKCQDDDMNTKPVPLQVKLNMIKRDVLPKTGCILGRGGFGVVKTGLNEGEFIAVKMLHGSRASSSACHEKLALNIPAHPHVVATHAFVQSTCCGETANIYWTAGKKHTKDTKISCEELKSLFSLSLENVFDKSCSSSSSYRSEWVWIVSELCSPLTLLSLINMPNLKVTLRDKIKCLGEMASGVSHLHSLGLNHLDLKPSNALITYDGAVKIADFGCCSPTNDNMGEPVIGTVAYQAPEVLVGGSGTSASDIFSLGVTIWHLVVGKYPYFGIHPHVVLYQVTRLNLRPNSLQCFSPHPTSLLEDLLLRIAERCWATHPTARPTAPALCRSLAALYLSPAM